MPDWADSILLWAQEVWNAWGPASWNCWLLFVGKLAIEYLVMFEACAKACIELAALESKACN